jgi:hypothetical protein
MLLVSAAVSASSQIDRANPRLEISSSIVPYVSTRSDAFETRTPPARLVSPPSPRIVLMLMPFSCYSVFH